MREGASLHTADELSLLLVDDLSACGVPLTFGQNFERERLASILARDTNPSSGCAWFNDPDEADAAQWLAEQVESSADGLWVIRNDGYCIVRPHADCPLLD
jgi:hypothetical protein